MLRLVKPFGGTIIGVDKDNTLKPNTVYEIVNILGELVIREVGRNSQSLAGGSDYGKDVHMLLLEGNALLTDSELS
jgi:hypothetical protein